MDEQYTRIYADLYRRHWWWRARERYLVTVLRRMLPAEGGNTILDVGAGGGLFFEGLSQFGQVYGVETDQSMRTGIPAVDGRIHWGPLQSYPQNRLFDAVLFLDVLEHVDEPSDLLRSALTLLSPHGVIVVTVPAFTVLWTRHDMLNEHKTRYSKASFRAVARRAGVLEREARYFFHWTFPAKVAVRLAEAFCRADAKSTLPTVPWPPLNRWLLSVSVAEQRLSLDRWLPFGSSLLFVGGKEADPY